MCARVCVREKEYLMGVTYTGSVGSCMHVHFGPAFENFHIPTSGKDAD